MGYNEARREGNRPRRAGSGERLMGTNPEERFDLISERAEFVREERVGI